MKYMKVPLALAASAALVGMAVTLFVMGRIPWGIHGPAVWTWSAWRTETSQRFGDPYSFSHILHGIIFFAVLTFLFRKISWESKFFAAMMIEIAWEIFENTPFTIERYRAATAALDYYGDSILNSLGDVMFCMLGFYIASKLPWKWTLCIVLAIELIMLLLIRDNLTLNILMLIKPISAIKEWQMMR